MKRHSEPLIEKARPADLSDMLMLLTQCKLPVEGLEAHLETALVAKQHGKIIGTAALELYGRAALLRSVAVDEKFRGTGLGRNLSTRALALAKEHGIEKIYLLTETAAPFFAKLGFQNIHRSQVDTGVTNSLEFTTLCPESAQPMVLILGKALEK